MPLKTINGLEVLDLQGSPSEMGVEHGRLMKDRIQFGIEHFLRKSLEIFEIPHDFLSAQARQYEPFIPHPYVEEMRALAEACDVPYEEILALNCLVDLDACYMQQILQCCNFVVGPPATRDGLLIHGRNLDFPHAGVVPNMAIVVSRKPSAPDAIPTLGVTWVGFVGMLTGYNAARLSAAEVGSPTKDVSLQGMPITFLLRDSLEHSHSDARFWEYLRSVPRTCGFNIALCDGKTAEARAIEFTHSQCETRTARRGSLVVDNVCLAKKTAFNRLTYAAGAFRYARMMQLIDQHRGQIDVPLAFTFLNDRYDMARARANGRGYNCICNHDTVHSVLFLPAEHRLYVAHGAVPAPTGEYREVNLNELWPEWQA